MVPVSSVETDQVWLQVNDAGAVGAVRRSATSLGTAVGLPEQRVADLAIVATELASNLYKHADDGAMLVQVVRHADQAGVELVATDKGPGLADLRRSGEDGHSTAGTLGIGLGAITRLSSTYDGYSRPERGTVLAASMWPGPAPALLPARGISRPMSGEDVTGDGYGIRTIGSDRLQLMLCDGLGHGPLAALAARAAEAAFRDAPEAGPKILIEHIHRALHHTRGAVVTVVEVDPAAATVRFAGLGNISGSVVDGDSRRMMSVQPGIAGHQRPQVRELELPCPPGALIILHSDGVTDRWNLADYPGLGSRDPIVVAATILRDASVRRDDAAVLVATRTA